MKNEHPFPENSQKEGIGGGDPPLHDNAPDQKMDNEPMTEAQQSYLKSLSVEAGEKMQGNLTRKEADRKIEDMEEKG